jgi:stage III sporulation protein AH
MKLNREQIRSKNKEALLEIVNNTSVADNLKQDAVNKMVAMTDIAEREAAAEMLLEAKGFSDVVVSITDDNCDVVLNMGEVTDAKRAQVEDIVKRKTNISADKIVITPIVVTDAE